MANVRRAKRAFTRAKGSKEVLTQGVEKHPESLLLRRLLSHALLQEGKEPQKAERVLREILEREPADQEAKHNLELLLSKAGK